jgi:hypothetical protein
VEFKMPLLARISNFKHSISEYAPATGVKPSPKNVSPVVNPILIKVFPEIVPNPVVLPVLISTPF